MATPALTIKAQRKPAMRAVACVYPELFKIAVEEAAMISRRARANHREEKVFASKLFSCCFFSAEEIRKDFFDCRFSNFGNIIGHSDRRLIKLQKFVKI